MSVALLLAVDLAWKRLIAHAFTRLVLPWPTMGVNLSIAWCMKCLRGICIDCQPEHCLMLYACNEALGAQSDAVLIKFAACNDN
jgi:hypothetical protein